MCNALVWIAVGLNLAGFALNLWGTRRAHKAWDQADEALALAIKARADALAELFRLYDEFDDVRGGPNVTH